MRSSIHNEYGSLTSVMLKRPADAFQNPGIIENQWKELNYTEKPDYDKSILEYIKFESLLSSLGPEFIFLDKNDSACLDSIYTRDATIATNRGMIICNMGKKARLFEPGLQKQKFEDAGIPVLGEVKAPGTVEGGDTAWLDENTLLIGRGFRTNDEGINQVKEMVSEFAEIVEVHLPYFKGPSDVFHLMSIFSPVDKDLALVYSPLMTVPFREFLKFRKYQFVEVPEIEFDSMGCNVLAISPRNCIMVEGNPITKSRLEEAGVKVSEYSGLEISVKGCGGPTCLTRPLSRMI